MTDEILHPAWRRVARPALFSAFAASLAFVTLVYVWSRLAVAAGKPLWLDEYYALSASVRGPSVLRSLLLGVPGQGSPSPLDYLLLKALDDVRHTTRFLGLPPLSYYRVVSTLAIVSSGIGLVVGCFPRSAQRTPWLGPAWAIALLCCLVAYWFQPFALEYATQMRPYALWLSLSFVAYAAAPPSSRWWHVAAWLGVAATSTAALYQIATVGAACVVVDAMGGRSWREIARGSLAPLAVPLAVALYYALLAGKWHYWGPEWGTWKMFREFWVGESTVAVLSGAGVALCMARRETRRFAVPCLAMLLLYLVAPVIYYLTRQRGFFFTERQFIYYELAGPVFMLTAVRCLGTWLEERPRIALGLAAALCAACLLLTGFLVKHAPIAAWEAWRGGRWPSFPADPDGALARTLSGGLLPAGFCPVDGGMPEGSVRNLELVADWLTVRYPNPVGEGLVYVMPDGDGARVVTVEHGRCAAGQFVAVHGSARQRVP